MQRLETIHTSTVVHLLRSIPPNVKTLVPDSDPQTAAATNTSSSSKQSWDMEEAEEEQEEEEEKEERRTNCLADLFVKKGDLFSLLFLPWSCSIPKSSRSFGPRFALHFHDGLLQRRLKDSSVEHDIHNLGGSIGLTIEISKLSEGFGTAVGGTSGTRKLNGKDISMPPRYK
ncbi:hypothetical protein C5167_040226 [Papaver somniferum]|uniref:Uncharacterized protein n=1 Tax=Papaver somniferum TaxID=3469 RepID=A0A4Y7IHQ2_PAPSO|nr:hypothetical protein C5167_040226 [Papaver somniferum]